MHPAEVLSIWSDCCAPAGVRWHLYGDALLCAKGYGSFPDTLKNAQVAVFAEDLPRILQQVIPALPRDWHPDIPQFAVKKCALSFLKDDAVMLEISVLHALNAQEEADVYSAKIRQIRANARTKTFLIRLLSKVLGTLFRNQIQKIKLRIGQDAFHALLELASTRLPNPAYYCDHLTNKNYAILPANNLRSTESLLCDGISYPVFSGYDAYLSEQYGDYATGLFDEIGCGLTAQDKVDLRHHQEHCKQALAAIQQISEEFGLRYYLIAGSVLGCVRHGGFIPWDDDIDLGIRIEDLERFEAVVKAELPKRLPKGFQLLQAAPNNGYPRMFSKICYEGRCCMDLWPLVPTYTDGLSANLTWYFAKIITKVHYKKLGNQNFRFVKLANTLSLFMSDKMVLYFARLNERKYRNRNTPAYINLYSIYRRNKENILRCWLDTEATAVFEGITVPIVGCTEAYLTHLYGDYMSCPPPWKRSSRHVERFEETVKL